MQRLQKKCKVNFKSFGRQSKPPRPKQEQISYGMPYYGYKGRLAYFAYAKHHIGLSAMPPIVKDHAKELRKYKTATATIRFPLNERLPIALVKKLVRVGVRNNGYTQAFAADPIFSFLPSLRSGPISWRATSASLRLDLEPVRC